MIPFFRHIQALGFSSVMGIYAAMALAVVSFASSKGCTICMYECMVFKFSLLRGSRGIHCTDGSSFSGSLGHFRFVDRISVFDTVSSIDGRMQIKNWACVA